MLSQVTLELLTWNEAIISFLGVVGYLIIVIVGVLHLRAEGKIKSSKLLILVGGFEIIYGFILYQLFMLVIVYGAPIHYDYVVIIVEIIPNIISLLTFGVLILILGMRNKENFGKQLQFSGIFWIISAGILLLYNVLGYLGFEVVWVYITLTIIILPLILVSRVFLLVYANKLQDHLLRASTILLFIASVVFIINRVLELIMYWG